MRGLKTGMIKQDEPQFTLRHEDGTVLITGTAKELTMYFTKIFKDSTGLEADFKPYVIRTPYGKESKCLIFEKVSQGTQKLAPSEILKLAHCQAGTLVSEKGVDAPC